MTITGPSSGPSYTLNTNIKDTGLLNAVSPAGYVFIRFFFTSYPLPSTDRRKCGWPMTVKEISDTGMSVTRLIRFFTKTTTPSPTSGPNTTKTFLYSIKTVSKIWKPGKTSKVSKPSPENRIISHRFPASHGFPTHPRAMTRRWSHRCFSRLSFLASYFEQNGRSPSAFPLTFSSCCRSGYHTPCS